MKHYVELKQGDRLQSGDEYFFAGKWMPITPEFIGKQTTVPVPHRRPVAIASDTSAAVSRLLAGMTDACANVHDDERLSELFVLAPVDATHIDIKDMGAPYLKHANGDEFFYFDENEWNDCSLSRSCIKKLVEIPPRERELNRLVQDFGSWAEVQDYAELSESRTVKVNGEWFRFQEWKERRDKRIAAGLIDVNDTNEPYATWDDVPDDLQEIVVEYPEWLNQHYDFVLKCEDNGDEFVMHCFEGDPRDKFSREQHKRARELYLQEHTQQDSQQEWVNGLPSVGVECRIRFLLPPDGGNPKFERVVIKGYYGGQVWFQDTDNCETVMAVDQCEFRPIQPEQKPDDHDKARDEIRGMLSYPTSDDEKVVDLILEWHMSRLTQGGGDE